MSPSTLITGIAELITNEADGGTGPLGIRVGAALVVEDGLIRWLGDARSAPQTDSILELGGRAVIPGFVDSHTHLVFAQDRAAEFAARMAGTPYDGGGIGVTRDATAAAGDDELRRLLAGRIAEARAQGTTTVEIKSGYGLTVEEEVRHLRIASEATSETTFLGAHVVPAERGERRSDYVDLVCGPMLTAAAPYARWIDVFCEPHSPHAFNGEESREVLLAGRAAGLGLRVHGNQLGPGPGVRLAVELGAASVDHCTHLEAADIDALASGSTVATLLPGVEFSTRSPYPDARRLLGAGVTVALATDCNPGTCASNSMPFMIALAVREMHMTPAEALWSATRGGALAVRRDELGLVRVGGPADLAVIDAPSHLHIPYRAGVPLVKTLEV